MCNPLFTDPNNYFLLYARLEDSWHMTFYCYLNHCCNIIKVEHNNKRSHQYVTLVKKKKTFHISIIIIQLCSFKQPFIELIEQ